MGLKWEQRKPRQSGAVVLGSRPLQWVRQGPRDWDAVRGGRARVDLQNVVRPDVDWKETFEVPRGRHKESPASAEPIEFS